MTTRRETGHLLRRAGFGARPADFDTYAPLSWSQAVERLLNVEATLDTLPADPTSTQEMPDSDEMRLSPMDVVGWWLDRMVRTERPLEEKLTFFWRDHFATALSKVPPLFMAEQNQLLRRLSLGNFGTLLRAVATDPAMLIFLDGHTSAAGNANENYARELMELHTLGQGNYTEQDIKEAARALTGWVVRPRFHTSLFVDRRHDSSTKQIFGNRGAFDLDGVIDLVLAHPAMPPFIAGKMTCYFIQDGVSQGFVDDLAAGFTAADLEIRPLLRAILNSDEFREGAYRAQIKSPTDFVVGAVRSLAVEVDPRLLMRAVHDQGQVPMNPPDPSGWPSGEEWINANTSLLRSNLAFQLSRMPGNGRHRASVAFNPLLLLERSGASDADALIQTFVDLLLEGEIDADDRAVLREYVDATGTNSTEAMERAARGVVYFLLASPAYALA